MSPEHAFTAKNHARRDGRDRVGAALYRAARTLRRSFPNGAFGKQPPNVRFAAAVGTRGEATP